MKVKIESTRIVKPNFEGTCSPPTPQSVPLSVFDKVNFNAHIAVIYAYRAPTPANATIEHGLQRVLSEYRELAGRLGKNEQGDPVIFLNDKGVKLVEASVDRKLDQFMPLKPSPILLSLHPSLEEVEELLQVQLTRFTCGSLIIGFTAHHLVADGHSTSNFLVAWGKACRGLDMSPLPTHDRTIFNPQNPPKIEFEHRGVEFQSKKLITSDCRNNNNNNSTNNNNNSHHFVDDTVVIHKVHFTLEFLKKLKASAASPLNYETSNDNKSYKCYTTFESLVAHLWRAITKARELGEYEKTSLQIGVNGRTRMNPPVPNEYFGNLVLWASPSSLVKDLSREPLAYAAKLIHDAIANVNDNYFKSFINFATTHNMEEEGLVPIAANGESVLSPNLEVNSWLRFPFYELDFGGGAPCMFMPSYFPVEGVMVLVPSFLGDGSIDAFVSLFPKNLATFKQLCHSL